MRFKRGNPDPMKVRKIIDKAMRHRSGGSEIVGDVNAVVSANVGEKESRNVVSSRRRTRIVQRNGRTEISETTDDKPEGGTE
jgi:hypothetical protein